VDSRCQGQQAGALATIGGNPRPDYGPYYYACLHDRRTCFDCVSADRRLLSQSMPKRGVRGMGSVHFASMLTLLPDLLQDDISLEGLASGKESMIATDKGYDV
jgi:hypothetical protein